MACLIGTACAGGDLVLPRDPGPALLEAVGGDEQAGEPGAQLPDPLVVKVTDGEGEPMAGVRVAFELGAGADGGETSPDTAVTGEDGKATASWVLGAATGLQRVHAEVVGAGVEVVSLTATAVAGAPPPSGERSTVAASPASIQAGTGLSVITVTVRDGRGDPVEGATVTIAATGPGNVLLQPSAPTGADGIAEGTLQSVVPGTKVVSATVNGEIPVGETAAVTVVVAPEPEGLAFVVQPSDVEEDEVIDPPVSVAVVDADGNVVPVSGIEISLELMGDWWESNELEGDTTRETVDGIAVFTDLEVDRDDDGYRLRATAPSRPELGSVDSETFDVED